MFSGYSREGLELLGQLPAMDKERFQATKGRYQAEILGPTKAFVESLGAALREAVSSSIHYAAKTNGSIAPINNDRRFNPDAPAYKDHLLLRFWDGPKKKTAPTLFVRITAKEVGFATGVVPEAVDGWREAVDRGGATLTDALTELRVATNADVVGQELKRVPRPYPEDHPHSPLLRHKWLQARWSTPLPESAFTDGFVSYCCDQLVSARNVHMWMREHLS